jgi:hypothetical protein
MTRYTYTVRENARLIYKTANLRLVPKQYKVPDQHRGAQSQAEGTTKKASALASLPCVDIRELMED